MREATFDEAGLIAGIVQHADTREVLMLGYLNQAAIDATRSTGFVHFWSRSRNALWRKGETSGNTLRLHDMRFDCDGDALLIEARPVGATCHTGTRTCFEEPHADSPEPVGFATLERLWITIADRVANRPAGSYTTSLLGSGADGAGRKVLEEAAEVVAAAIGHARRAEPTRRVDEEAADLIYHLLVLIGERGSTPAGALRVLAGRAG